MKYLDFILLVVQFANIFEFSTGLKTKYIASSDTFKEELIGDIPQAFIIGASKCATTSLHGLLSAHPDVCHSNQKEKHFFDVPIEDFRADLAAVREYRRKFQSTHTRKHCKMHLDSTPAYIRGNAIDNMHTFFTSKQFENKHFILVLRDPVARECSWYQHFARGCINSIKDRMISIPKTYFNSGTEGAWTRQELCANATHGYCETLGCLQRNSTVISVRDANLFDNFSQFVQKYDGQSSRYDVQISHWLEFVERRQILILSMRDLLDDTYRIMKAVTSFLNISMTYASSVKLPKKNINELKDEIPKCDCASLERLRTEFDRLKTVPNTVAIIRNTSPHESEPYIESIPVEISCVE